MKIKIGPYRKWIGPYQLADLLQYIGVSEDTCYSIGKRLSETWVGKFCQWIHEKKSRKIKIKIDPYDTWNMDHTLALIIVPMLKQLKENKHGAPFVDNEDVPEELRRKETPDIPFLEEPDEKHFERWDYVIDEMIWAFEQVVDSDDDYLHIGDKEFQDRIDNGLKLFGKYYRALWD